MERIPSSHGSYSDSVRSEGAGSWIHIAGQLGVELDGTGAEKPLGTQAEVAFDRLDQALTAAGASLSDIVSMTTYVTSFDDWAQFAAVRGERLGTSLPASTAVQVTGLMGGAAVEIDAIAFLPAET